MELLEDPALAALEAIRELRQRIEGFVPFEQAEYVAELFSTAIKSIQQISGTDKAEQDNRPL